MQALWLSRGIALLFSRTLRHQMGVEGVSPTPRPLLPPGKTRYPLYWVGPRGRSGRAENFVPAGIRSRTVQPVVSRYTD